MQYASLVSRLRFMLVMKLVVASTLFLFVDQVLALTIFVAALVTVSFLVYVHTRPVVSPARLLAWFHLCIGAVFLVAAGVLLLVGSEFFKVVAKSVVGLVLLALGFFALQKEK